MHQYISVFFYEKYTWYNSRGIRTNVGTIFIFPHVTYNNVSKWSRLVQRFGEISNDYGTFLRCCYHKCGGTHFVGFVWLITCDAKVILWKCSKSGWCRFRNWNWMEENELEMELLKLTKKANCRYHMLNSFYCFLLDFQCYTHRWSLGTDK